MKIIKLVLILFFPTYFMGQNKTTEAHDNSMHFRVLYDFTQQATKNNEPFFLTDTMALDVGLQRSVYYDYNLFVEDSLRHAIFTQNRRTLHFSYNDEELERRLEMRGAADDIIGDRLGETSRTFKDLVNENIITLDRNPLNLQYVYKVEEKINQEWEITGDTATIFNYSCQKAITHFRGRTYYAWFTLDIPVSDGPWKFFGLPGLILYVEDDKSLFRFMAIGLEKTNQSRYFNYNPNSSKAEKITFNELNLLKQKQVESVSYGFIDDASNKSFFRAKNPVRYIDLEISD